MKPIHRIRTEAPIEERYEALVRLSKAISAHRDPKELFCVLASELRSLVSFDAIGVVLYDEAANRIRPPLLELCSRPGLLLQPDIATEETMASWVYQHQQPLVVSFADQEARLPRGIVDQMRKFGLLSACVIPMTTAHRRLGSIGVGSERPDAYSGEEVRFLALVADIVALAVDDALNFEASQVAQEELRREKDRLKLLLDLTNRIVSNLELRDLLRTISATLRQVMQCDVAGVALPDPESSRLRVYAFDFPEGKGYVREETLIPMGGSVPGRVFRTGKSWTGNTRDLPRSGPEDDPVLAEGHRAGCFLPLVSRDRVLGVLGLGRLEESPFAREEVGFLEQVANQVAIAVDNSIAYREIGDLRDRLARENLYLEDEIRSEMNFEEIVGKSAALRKVLAQVETVAPTESTVLVYGETGSGKERIARAIHNLSSRRASAFVKLNCAAIPTGLLESEIFGHEKGAFTGAITQRIGRFELASRGTVFLDEIGEIPVELQPKLLRVLQEREFERLGSTRTLRTDARLIAATNRDLAFLVKEQKFRPDLFYRLNVFPIHVPPLRERPEDIPLLVRHYAEQFARRLNKTIDSIPSDTMNALCGYAWPGNIRELQNVIERAVILSQGPVLKVPLPDPKASGAVAAPDRRDTLKEAERKHILSALEETRWVVGGPNGAAHRRSAVRRGHDHIPGRGEGRHRRAGGARPGGGRGGGQRSCGRRTTAEGVAVANGRAQNSRHARRVCPVRLRAARTLKYDDRPDWHEISAGDHHASLGMVDFSVENMTNATN
ncbi:MAG TPA: sigma 54-interacting transcriptional regulator [Candidatus Deferrimicrobiaceae bacterium]|jgi:formate hydrogenlyase transcriptional activator|nr:sigma 54-interacting transcriptional regulator [Candidatus Deferrimicrobiaceae bacterium]